MIVDERCEGCLHYNPFYDSEPFYLRSEECRECLKKDMMKNIYNHGQKKQRRGQTMTDNEIIKSLKCYLITNKCTKLGTDILDLIDRQKAEIERLKKQNSISQRLLSEAWHSIEEKDKFCKTVKTEAIREFAERLKNLIYPQLSISTYEKGEAFHFCLDEIDSLVKEMTEEKL